MIPRYSRPDMVAIWSPDTRFRIWFEIEAHAADAMAELGVIPKEAAKTIWAKGKAAKFDVARIDAIEARSNTTSRLSPFAEIVGPEVFHAFRIFLGRARHLPNVTRARRRYPNGHDALPRRSSAARSNTK